MQSNRKSLLLLLVTILFAGYVINIVSQGSSKPRDDAVPNLSTMLPGRLPGWSVKDRPVGETEEVRQKMGEILDYDAAINREYSKGLITIEVYVSYWSPGKAHFRAVYGHTPDVCWVQAGWKPTVQDPSYHFILNTEPVLTLKTGQYREFTIGKELFRVMFWQLLDGEPFTYGNFSYPPATAIFTDILTRGFDQKPEQWFIRISANVDFGRLKADRGFQELMRSMVQFGLKAKTSE
jgi:hypothetical protein